MSKSLLFIASLFGIISAQSGLGSNGFKQHEEIFAFERSDISSLYLEPTKVINLGESINLKNLNSKNCDYLKFKLDEKNNVIDGANKTYGSLDTFYEEYLKGKVLPCIEIDTHNVALNYKDYISSTCYIRDLAILSKDISVFYEFSKVKELSNNYFVFDISDYDLNNKTTISNIIKVGNVLDINTFVINSNHQDLDSIISTFQKNNKTVWLDSENDDREIAFALSSGSDGVISSNQNLLTKSLGKFDSPGSTKAQYLAAHRGVLDKNTNENSLRSIRNAVSYNADFVEIDLQITKDKKIILCHNDKPKFTSDCDENFSFHKKNYKDVVNFKLNDNDVISGETFPLLSDVFKENKDNNIIFILEFKFDAGFETASWDVAKYVNEVVEEYNMQDRVIGISFFSTYFESIKKHMPYMETLYLGLENVDAEFRKISNVSGLMKYVKKRDVGIDYSYSADYKKYSHNYINRGYPLGAYTFKDNSNLSAPINIATSDNVIDQSELVKKFSTIKNNVDFNTQSDLSNVKFLVEKFNGQTEEISCPIKIIQGDIEKDKYLIGSAYYYDSINNYGIYSDGILLVNKNIDEKEYERSFKNGTKTFEYSFKEIEKIPNLERTNSNYIIYIVIGSIAIALIAVISGYFLYKKLTKIKNRC